MQLPDLAGRIQSLHETLQRRVASSANVGLTARNWLIGAHIVEYEQNGEDRAEYGAEVIPTLVKMLRSRGMSATPLKLSRQFFLAYPEIGPTLSGQFGNLFRINDIRISQTLSDQFEVAPALSETSARPDFAAPPELLLTRLSFSHFVELLKIDDPLKRAFYEIEAIKGHWSVRELKRQAGSLLYERTGLSTDKEQLLRLVGDDAEAMQAGDVIRDPYVFEFLGLKPRETVRESDLETALLDHLQSFLLELGRGFCFEDRQKRIRIGTTDYFIDLVFYHRLLKCHVLIDLKVEPFTHANAGQLNTYLNYYRKHEMGEGDRPPIGLLLCTDKDHALVEYALGGMNEQLFVSEYRVALPSEEEIRRLLEREARHLPSPPDST